METPTSGKVLINDVDVTQYDRNVLRTNMSVLFQDFQKFYDLTVNNNVGIGDPTQLSTLPSIRKAASESGADEFIRKFPGFYETRLHRTYEGFGSDADYYIPFSHIKKNPEREIPYIVKQLCNKPHYGAKIRGKPLSWEKPDLIPRYQNIPPYDPKKDDSGEIIPSQSLSGGQWQRVALARAFMKLKVVDLLILDEPSSALDPQAEYEVFKTIMELRKGKTTIYIVNDAVCEKLT